MNVCLVSPSTVTDFEDRGVAESDAVRLLSENAPVGILTLAAVLELKRVPVRTVDLNRLYYEYLRSAARSDFCTFVTRRLAPEPADVFGFSTICSSYPLTIRIAREVKRSRPDAAIVLGGPQASVVDVPTLTTFPFIDFVVRGEAEETLPLLLDALSHSGRYEDLPGITFRRGETVVRNPNAPVIAELDQIPMPAYHLYPKLKNCETIPLEIGRGCPFSCTFCSTNDFFRRRFRLKSPARVIEQMKSARRLFGIRRFDLIHDMFTVDRRKVVEFCEALMACGERFTWGCSARTDCIDEELIALMAKAGCRGIFFGIETGSARLQRVIDKGLDLSQAARHIRSATAHQIATTVSLISGFPEETQQDLRDTVGFLMDAARFEYSKPQFHVLAPLAGTPIETACRDKLVFDEIHSDISYQGWRQDPADRSLIAAHADIFPNFYAVPTGLDRPLLKDLRDFILHGMEWFRWLLIALHQHSGSLLDVYQLWRQWAAGNGAGTETVADSPTPYYSQLTFRRDFLTFVRTRYLPVQARSCEALAALLDYEAALDPDSPSGETAAEPDDLPRLAPGVRVVRLKADYKRILECLRSKQHLDSVPSRPVVIATRPGKRRRTEVLQLSALSARLLSLCDGTRTVDEIGKRSGLGRTACVFALETLRSQHLLAYQPAQAAQTARAGISASVC